MDVLRVLVCDDSDSFREGLRALLSTSPEVDVVGEAAEGAAAVEAALALQPDVVLMDLTMPGTGGVEATRRLLAHSPHIAVLVLTMAEDDASVFAALQAGARGYLLKGARKAEILRAVQAVTDGGAVLGAPVATRLAALVAGRPRPESVFPELSAREREVLVLLTEHLTNGEIAARLGLSEKTVRNRVSNVLAKLRVATRAEAVAAARRAGL
ncbi:two component transcriptional regulator, LuxR family [Geodermatophilus dictyosporus]|uniref:Two component transcriptional regulator, LuxR family n=1 Tax=Geodermatophilus dictyosporus TaxID=1523247 RepID=A0A1I5U6G7_9ACTN|nr:two component transcriptional regulator, LuxR family [Geodermatophilus dictyosporus]